jgi:hypothetical protein
VIKAKKWGYEAFVRHPRVGGDPSSKCIRHPRAGGDPLGARRTMDSRLRGNDGAGRGLVLLSVNWDFLNSQVIHG